MVNSITVFPPLFRVTDSNGDVVSGGKIKFYAAGTTTPRTVYSDSSLSTSLGSTVYTGSDGVPVASSGSSTEVTVYTGTTAYKVVITDSSDVEIATFDNLSGALDTSGFLTTESASTLSFPVVVKTSDYTLVAGDNGKVINANSTGGDITLTLTAATTLGDGWNIEVRHTGSANSVILSTSQTISYAGNATATTYTMTVGETVQLVCDASGFHVMNAIPFPSIPIPQGYLTPTSATPIISGDVTSATSVYYTPFVGNLAPVWNGARFMPRAFSELTLTLSSSHSASGIYDVFLFSNSGALTLATGPVWSTVTAGSCARGTGAGTTQLTRTNGIYVNTVAMTGRNGSTTYSISAGYATYLGSIFIDSTQGQVSCHRGYGQSRKWGIWNAYNRQPVYLKAGDATSTWTYASSTVRAANGSSANSLTLFSGLAEDMADLVYDNYGSFSTSTGGNVYQPFGAIGYNSTTTRSGFASLTGINTTGSQALNFHLHAHYVAPPALGINVVTALEANLNTGTATFSGTEAQMLLAATWRA